MRLTRRGKELVAICLLVVTVGALSRSPVWVYIAMGLGGILLAGQLVATRAFIATMDAVALEYEPLERTVDVEEPVTCRLAVTLTPPHALEGLTIPQPVGTTDPADPQQITIDQTTAEETVTFEYVFPTAGTHTLPAPQLTLRDGYGLFEETVPTECAPTITVVPAIPRHVHVGQGGEELAAFGAHATDRQGSGIQPTELRQYQPGDATRRIDWKATARLREAYVREFEAETDRQTVLVLDERNRMAIGPPGRTMLAHTREVGAAIAEVATRYSDPLGLYALGDDSLTVFTPGTSPTHYARISEALLTASAGTASPRQPAITDGTGFPRERIRARLAVDTSTFAKRLGPYFSGGRTIDTGGETTLRETVSRIGVEAGGPQWLALFTDDTDRDATRAAVEHAAETATTVSVFLTPEVLFETGSFGDLEQAYQRYAAFETFRRSLATHPRVEAYEVAPGDRLHTLLTEAQHSETTPRSQ